VGPLGAWVDYDGTDGSDTISTTMSLSGSHPQVLHTDFESARVQALPKLPCRTRMQLLARSAALLVAFHPIFVPWSTHDFKFYYFRHGTVPEDPS
jgi:hypothetical protein